MTLSAERPPKKRRDGKLERWRTRALRAEAEAKAAAEELEYIMSKLRPIAHAIYEDFRNERRTRKRDDEGGA